MYDWGLNPSSVQVIISSVVGLGTLVLLVIVYIGTQAGRRSAKAAQESTNVLLKEAELRTRPWLGISECIFTPDGGDDDAEDGLITIHYQNVGALPAQDVVMSLVILPNMVDSFESYEFEDQVIGSIFPQEPGYNRFPASMLRHWETSDEDTAIEGVFK